MNRQKLTIGLFGFGCAGNGLYEVLAKTPALCASIKKICVKHKNKQRSIEEHHFIYYKDEIINDAEINVVVELIDDAEAAYEIVKSALQKGKAVVTANKKMLAEHLQELLELQQQYNIPLLYEAACCASIPVIRNLEEYYDNDWLESIEGIVNGSTNYILTKTSEGLSYSDALQDAQQKGYAESNPWLDTGGFDAKYKLVILLAHAFGCIVHPDQLFNSGIDQLGETEIKYAAEKKLKIKLVAQAVKTASGKISAFVLPKFVNEQDKLFDVDDVFNGIKTKNVFSDMQFFYGKGAGAYPTASAVLSDISALTYHYRYEYKKLKKPEVQEDDCNIYLKGLLRFRKIDDIKFRCYFFNIEESHYGIDSGYFIGTVTLENLRKLYQYYDNFSFILIEDKHADQLSDAKPVKQFVDTRLA